MALAVSRIKPLVHPTPYTGPQYISDSAEFSSTQPVDEARDGPYLAYNLNLKAPIHTEVNANPKAEVHASEWKLILAGEPVEINPSDGFGFKVMSIPEWTHRWKARSGRNDDFCECLACGSKSTKEHHFYAQFARSAFRWESECFCADCHMWTYREYTDPEYLDPKEREKHFWNKETRDERKFQVDWRKKALLM